MSFREALVFLYKRFRYGVNNRHYYSLGIVIKGTFRSVGYRWPRNEIGLRGLLKNINPFVEFFFPFLFFFFLLFNENSKLKTSPRNCFKFLDFVSIELSRTPFRFNLESFYVRLILTFFFFLFPGIYTYTSPILYHASNDNKTIHGLQTVATQLI